LLGLGSLAYARDVEPRWIAVTPVHLKLPRLDAEFDGYRVVQISDIHMGGWMSRGRLGEIAATINRQSPDLVVVTGDFVTYKPQKFAADIAAALSTLRPCDAALAVLGNHDHWTNAGIVRQIIRDSGMIDVSNAVHTVRRGRAMLHIAGVDDFWVGKADLERVLKRLPPLGAAILLAHEPDFADTSAASGRFDLQLSGHSHGGQVIIPLLGPPVLPPYGRKYPVGRYQVGDMIQYTNRGVGMVHPQVRFNCRPEITVFTLEAADAKDV
jgi:hypothetical protein